MASTMKVFIYQNLAANVFPGGTGAGCLRSFKAILRISNESLIQNEDVHDLLRGEGVKNKFCTTKRFHIFMQPKGCIYAQRRFSGHFGPHPQADHPHDLFSAIEYQFSI